MVDESILTSVKQKVGIVEEYEAFDKQIIMDINSVFLELNQRGVGPSKLFVISDKNAMWSEFLDDDRVEAVKAYVGYRVQLMFDTPASSVLTESLKDKINEFGFRLAIEFGKKKKKKNDISSSLW